MVWLPGTMVLMEIAVKLPVAGMTAVVLYGGAPSTLTATLPKLTGLVGPDDCTWPVTTRAVLKGLVGGTGSIVVMVFSAASVKTFCACDSLPVAVARKRTPA